MERTNLSTIIARPVEIRVPRPGEGYGLETEARDRNDLIIVDPESGNIIGMFSRNGLFDHNGNLFTHDV